MATYQEIAKDLRQQHKGQSFYNVTELSAYLGWGPAKVRSALADVDCYIQGKERRFHALDVAKKICEYKTINIYG